MGCPHRHPIAIVKSLRLRSLDGFHPQSRSNSEMMILKLIEYDSTFGWWSKRQSENIDIYIYIHMYSSNYSIYSPRKIVKRTTSYWNSGAFDIPSGKHLHNYGTSPVLMGKSTISMAIFWGPSTATRLLLGSCRLRTSSDSAVGHLRRVLLHDDVLNTFMKLLCVYIYTHSYYTILYYTYNTI